MGIFDYFYTKNGYSQPQTSDSENKTSFLSSIWPFKSAENQDGNQDGNQDESTTKTPAELTTDTMKGGRKAKKANKTKKAKKSKKSKTAKKSSYSIRWPKW
jgi:hypothetical protein